MQKKKLLSDLIDIVERSREAANYHQKEVDNLKSFYENSVKMVKNEAPELEEKYKEIMQHFVYALDREQELTAAEMRAAEDLNDVAARFDIVYRVSEETVEKTANVKRCSNNIKALREKLQEDLAKGGLKQQKIETEIQAAIEAKKKAVEEADLKLQEFIAVKESYNRFKVRRIQHAYTTYGQALANCLTEASKSYDKLSAACNVSEDEIVAIIEKGVPTPEETPQGEETK